MVMHLDNEIFVGVCGGSASGKTTLCNDLMKYFENDIQIISQDSYYIDRSHLSDEEIKSINFDHPESINTHQLYKDVMALKGANETWIPQYCFKSHSVLESKVKLEKKRINIIEGLYVLNMEELRDLFDFKIYIHADDDVRIIRRIQRDVEQRGRDLKSILDQYLSFVKPMNDQYVVKQKKYADTIINTTNSSDSESNIDSLISKIKRLVG